MQSTWGIDRRDEGREGGREGPDRWGTKDLSDTSFYPPYSRSPYRMSVVWGHLVNPISRLAAQEKGASFLALREVQKGAVQGRGWVEMVRRKEGVLKVNGRGGVVINENWEYQRRRGGARAEDG